MLIVSVVLFLTGCKETNILQPEEQPTEASAAKAFLETLAPKLGKTSKDIVAQTFSWGSIDGELPGWFLRNDAIRADEKIWDKLYEIFDSWVEKTNGDGAWEIYVEYLKGNLICSVYSRLNYDLDEVRNLMYLEEEDPVKQEEKEKKLDKIFSESDLLVEVHCAEFNEKYPSPLEFTFNLFGEEPFWDAELRVDSLSYTLPNNDTHQFDTDSTYIWSWGTSGKNLIFSGEKYNFGEIVGELSKEACVDGGIGNTHEYKARVTFWEGTFEGCADKVDNFLVSGRQGKLENLLKKINYKKYTWKMNPKTASYQGIQTQGDLVEIFLTQEGSEETEYLVLGKTDDGRTTYWQGENPVDDETCEKFVNVPGLMDFGIFSSCPRG